MLVFHASMGIFSAGSFASFLSHSRPRKKKYIYLYLTFQLPISPLTKRCASYVCELKCTNLLLKSNGYEGVGSTGQIDAKGACALRGSVVGFTLVQQEVTSPSLVVSPL